MQSVSTRMWRILIAVMVFALVGGLLLFAVLAAGWANPPRDRLAILGEPGSASPPFTLETSIHSGFSVTCSDSPMLYFTVRNDGYFSVTETREPDWRRFIHIDRDHNTLYLNVNANGEAVFRINEEITWTRVLSGSVCAFAPLAY